MSSAKQQLFLEDISSSDLISNSFPRQYLDDDQDIDFHECQANVRWLKQFPHVYVRDGFDLFYHKEQYSQLCIDPPSCLLTFGFDFSTNSKSVSKQQAKVVQQHDIAAFHSLAIGAIMEQRVASSGGIGLLQEQGRVFGYPRYHRNCTAKSSPRKRRRASIDRQCEVWDGRVLM